MRTTGVTGWLGRIGFIESDDSITTLLLLATPILLIVFGSIAALVFGW